MTGEECMAAALAEAKKAYTEGETPVGAALFRGDILLAADHNRTEQKRDPLAHAELLVLREGLRLTGGRLAGCTLYVTMEPCPMCTGAILHARPDRVVFGCFDDKAGCLGGALSLPDCLDVYPVEIRSLVLADEAASLLKSFFAERRTEKAAR